MQKKQSSYERIILGLVALIAIAVAGYLIFLALGFQNTLQAKTPKVRNESEPPPTAKVDDSIKRAMDVPKPWTAPERNNKNVPLNKSVLLALQGEDIVDMYLEVKQVRPPMTNQYLRENNLEWQHPNVGELDPDDDGFNNLEEFEAVPPTKPKDGRSHPPITGKLFMVQRIAKDYNIILKNSSGQISLPDETGRNKKTYFLNLNTVGKEPLDAEGKPIYQMIGGTGDRFRVKKWEPKTIPDPVTGTKDVSELTIEEVINPANQIVLVMNVPTNLAEYSVAFQFRLKQIIDIPPVAKGGKFRIPGHEETTYQVKEIEENQATINPLDNQGSPGKEIIVKKG
jgi:hypothetical protein